MLSNDLELKSRIKSMINMWGIKNILSAMIDVLSERMGDNDKYIKTLCINLISTLFEYEDRYIENGKDIRFDKIGK